MADSKNILIRHICEVCGKEEILTPDEAYSKGWDYPPRLGDYGIVSPRICKNCSITETLWFNIIYNKQKMESLTVTQQVTLKRILEEPESICVEEKRKRR